MFVVTFLITHTCAHTRTRAHTQPSDCPDQLPCKVLHWGGGRKDSIGPRSSDILLELGAKQVVASDKYRLVLTVHGTVYDLKLKDSGDYTATVSCNLDMSSL